MFFHQNILFFFFKGPAKVPWIALVGQPSFALMIRYFTVLMLLGFTGDAQEVGPRDIVINEVLFNPVKDVVRLSGRVQQEFENWIDLQEMFIANRNSTGDIASMKPLSKEPLLLPAGTCL